MKVLATWSMMIWKRLWKKPLFVFSLILIPLPVWGLQLTFSSKDAIMKVALYCDNFDPAKSDNRLECEIMKRLLSYHTGAVTFYACDSPEDLERDVERNTATCGYVFPENMSQLLEKHIINRTPVIIGYRHHSEFTSRLVDEFVYSELYSDYSFSLLKQHISAQTGSADEEKLHFLYDKYRTEYTFMEYEYIDGTKNKVLSDDNTNYTLLPLRGMVATLILLSGLVGSLFWCVDKERHVFTWLKKGSHRIKLLYLTIPAGLGGILGIYAITSTGFATSLPVEIASMFCYILAVVGFCDILSTLIPGPNAYPAILPIATVGSVLLCPVFADLTSFIPAIRPLRWFTPVSHYLLGIYNTYGRLQLIGYGVTGILLSFVIQKAYRALH
ncbi:MAG: hypothetical protein J1E62_05050 [Lachnospiraceae bacterium]|nr:hypothetical protein [Lachnospiraceae bacterium]